MNAPSAPVIEGKSAARWRLVELSPSDHGRWKEFVTGHPDGNVFMLPAWTEVLRREYRRELLCLGCEDFTGHLQGVLPLLETRGLPFSHSPRTGRRWSSLPRTPLAGPLSVGNETTAMLLEAAVDHVRSRGRCSLELKPDDPSFDDFRNGLGMVRWRPTYVRRLSEAREEIRFGDSRNHARIEWSVRKATRLGVSVRSAESEQDLHDWYELYLSTLRPRVIPPRPFRFFRAIWDVMGPEGMLRFLLAEQRAAGRTTLLAGSIFLGFGKTLFYSFNGSRRDRESLSLRPNDLIIYHAIHGAHQSGFQEFDFGEVTEGNQGLAQFKSKWGADERWLYRYYYPPKRGFAAEGAHRRLRSLGNALWRRLPTPLTHRLGAWLYAYM